MEAASLWLDQRVKREGDDLVVLRVRLACIGKNGKPVRLPVRLRTALMRWPVRRARPVRKMPAF